MIMKLIRWLFSNIILIAFVLALTYAYVYWDNLTGEDTPAGKAIAYLSVEYDEVREYLDSYDFGSDQAGGVTEPEPVAAAKETASVPQMMPPPRPQVRPPAQQQPVPPRQIAQSNPQPARSPVPPTAMMQQPPASQQASRPQAPPQAMMQEPPARQPVPQPVAPVREPVPAAPETKVTAKPAPSTRELWISAREEYHRGNIEGSISNYQQVIANSEDNYDAYGELGNVYLSRGKYREAASAYFEAASILVKQGQTGRARSLLPMLERLDRNKAEELQQLINTSNS